MRLMSVPLASLPADLDWVVVEEAGDVVAFVREDAGPGDLVQIAEAVCSIDAARLAS